jgi:hypothetical protein
MKEKSFCLDRAFNGTSLSIKERERKKEIISPRTFEKSTSDCIGKNYPIT